MSKIPRTQTNNHKAITQQDRNLLYVKFIAIRHFTSENAHIRNPVFMERRRSSDADKGFVPTSAIIPILPHMSIVLMTRGLLMEEGTKQL